MTNVDPTIYVGGKEEYPEKLEEILRKQKQVMERKFTRSRLETLLVYYDQIPEYTNPSLPRKTIMKILKEMNQNQSYYLGR